MKPYPPIINTGSPVGPGFVVYERAPGRPGYDLDMARKSVGPGWAILVEALFAAIEHDKKWNPKSGFANCVITQVKEKFGVLRIYFYVNEGALEGGFDAVEGYIGALAAVSQHICETCGKPGRLRDRAWMVTLCDECDTKERQPITEQSIDADA